MYVYSTYDVQYDDDDTVTSWSLSTQYRWSDALNKLSHFPRTISEGSDPVSPATPAAVAPASGGPTGMTCTTQYRC